MAAVLLAAGAYTSISFFVDSWEGRPCWILGYPTYVRLPFASALLGAISAALNKAHAQPFSAIMEFLGLTAFLWAGGAVWIARGIVIPLIALLIIGVPLALTVYDQVNFGIDLFCDGHGMTEFGHGVIQLFIVLPLGVICFFVAASR